MEKVEKFEKLQEQFIPTFSYKLETIVESTEKGKKYILRGPVAYEGLTENGRYYSKSLWENNINRMKPLLKERKVTGEIDHPVTGTPSLARVTHTINDIWMEGNQVCAEIQIIPGTFYGSHITALLEAKLPIGVSSRGRGRTIKKFVENRQVDAVRDDYILETFDLVLNPAYTKAYPTLIANGLVESILTESKDFNIEQDSFIFEGMPIEESLQALSLENKKLKQEAEIEEEKYVDALRSLVEQEIISKVESDPELLGAKEIISNIIEMLSPYLPIEGKAAEIIAQKDEEIEKLREIAESLQSEIKILEQKNLTSEKNLYTVLIENCKIKTLENETKEDRQLILQVLEKENIAYNSLQHLQESIWGIKEDIENGRKIDKANQILENYEAMRREHSDLKRKLNELQKQNNQLTIQQHTKNRLAETLPGTYNENILNSLKDQEFKSIEEADKFVNNSQQAYINNIMAPSRKRKLEQLGIRKNSERLTELQENEELLNNLKQSNLLQENTSGTTKKPSEELVRNLFNTKGDF